MVDFCCQIAKCLVKVVVLLWSLVVVIVVKRLEEEKEAVDTVIK